MYAWWARGAYGSKDLKRRFWTIEYQEENSRVV